MLQVPCTPGSAALLPWGQLALVHVYVDFPYGGRLSQADRCAVQTLPLASLPYTVGSATGAGVNGDFSSNWKK